MAELKRTLGFWPLLAISISSIIGTGMFIGPAIAASYSGTASLVAWVILLVVAVYVAACFGELVAMFPRAGGVYEYTKQTYGRFFSFTLGWLAWITENITTPLLILAALNYLTPAHFPMFYKILVSLVFVVLLNIIAYVGIEASSLTAIFFTIITLIVLLAIIIPGFFIADFSNLSPFFTHPFSMVFVTLFFIIETFFGWEATTYLSEEAKEPEKSIPKALITATVIIGLLGVSLALLSISIFSWEKLAGLSAPLNDISMLIFGSFGVYITGIGVYLIVIGSAATGIIAAPRLLYAMARDRLFLPQFTSIHPKYHTPYKAVIFQTVVSALVLFLALGVYKTMLSILVPLVLIMYIITLLAIPILRYRKPELHRPFRVWFGKVGPILVSIFYLSILATWLLKEPGALSLFMLSLGIVLIGIPVYFLLEMYYNPKAIRSVSNLFSYATLWTERLLLPIKVRKEIIALLGNIKGKNVLEFGCSVGTLTMHLAEEVTKDGKVYAIDLSERETGIARKRLESKGHHHVVVLYDKHLYSRLHPSVPDIHTVVSVGMLSYLQNVRQVLLDMNRRLKVGSKVCFVDYDKFFDFIPTVAWLEDDRKIKRIFHDAGFSVDVFRKQGFAWKYIYIYGIKVRAVK
ncbi:amino acid permease [Candidatus Woesearchaeota archaeon]|nr:amino acid permease [Candidatus Woesearchaeota archaeon]